MILQNPASQPFAPAWSLHPTVIAGVLLLAGLYFWGIGPARRRYSLGPPAPAWRVLCFTLGLVVLLVSLNGPIHDLSDSSLFSVRMAQHLLPTTVLPPLLIAGPPGWLVERAGRGKGRRAVATVVTRPVSAGVSFSITLLVWHTVGAYDLMMRSHVVHIATHLLFIGAAVLLWWPVTSPVPSLPALPPPLGLLYLFLVQLPMQLLGAIITFADDPLYP